MKCTTTGRQCRYRVVSESPSRQIASPSNAGLRERRAFEFYFHQAGPALSGNIDLDFWRGSVLQICRLEPSVWDAIISLSALYERPPIHETSSFRLINGPAAVENPFHQEALVWYSRSLAALQQRISQGVADLAVSLISCILFITIELLQGNRKAALALYSQGMQLLASSLDTVNHRASVDRGFLTAAVKPIFRRLGTWVLINSDTVDYHGGFDLDVVSVQSNSIDEARNSLCGIVAEMKALNIDAKSYWRQPADFRIREISVLEWRQQQLQSRLHQWFHSFMGLGSMRNTSPRQAAASDGATALLLMTHNSVLIETETMLKPDQAAYDDYEVEFTQILDYASTAITSTQNSDGKQPPFVFEMGVFLPLFITALKCRFPQLRRRALHFLWEAPPAQGMFLCRPAAHVVAVLVALEEDPMTVPLEASDVQDLLDKPGHIPASEDRVWEFRVSSDVDGAGGPQTWLHYILHRADGGGRVQPIEKSVLLLGIDRMTTD